MTTEPNELAAKTAAARKQYAKALDELMDHGNLSEWNEELAALRELVETLEMWTERYMKG